MRKKAEKPKPCDCVKQMNEQIDKLDYQLTSKHRFEREGHMVHFLQDSPIIAVERIRPSKKKTPTVLCTYCPFCGKKKQP